MCNLLHQDVRHFLKFFFKSHSFEEVAPFHIAAAFGSLELCEHIITKASKKNPQGDVEIYLDFYATPTRFHIGKGQGLILVDHKITPLHMAAVRGNSELCRIIMDNIDDCNPKSDLGKGLTLYLP